MRLTSTYMLAGALFLAPASAALDGTVAGLQWHITGDLSEACSCSVPCSCNFGQSPSPHAFCYALFGLDIQNGSYGNVDLSGLRLAGANGPKGGVWYIDERANMEQTEALKAIGDMVWRKALEANRVTD